MTTTEPTRARTDWTTELRTACRGYADFTGRAITASTMVYPSNPGIYVRVDDELPRSFATAKDAATAIKIWTHAPGAARKGAGGE